MKAVRGKGRAVGRWWWLGDGTVRISGPMRLLPTCYLRR